jgi:putative transcriptional regulator
MDPNFAQTVVLLTDHSVLGSIGLVINRTSDVSVVTSMPELQGLEDDTNKLRIGGPLAIHSIRLLVSSAQDINFAVRLLDGVYFVNSTASLRALLVDTPPARKPVINYYAGYAAWRPGQLGTELARGDWHLIKGDPATIFEHDSETMWDEFIEKLAGTWVLMENHTERTTARPPSM